MIIKYMQNSHDLVKQEKIESGDKNVAAWQKFMTSPNRRSTSFIDTSPSRGLTASQKDRFLKSMFG